jgi:glycosyltransferase involved in cell wall biosynthesis
MTSASLRVLGFESYDTGSHRAVRQLVEKYSRHQWTWLTRPGRGWKWRMRLAAVELVDEAARTGLLDKPIDVIVATSLLGVADLRALLPARLRSVPVVLYMHENQAAYPSSDHPRIDPARDVHFAITNLTSVLAADRVIWNSRWNRDSFLEGMELIIRRANAVDLRGWREKVEARSTVIWPPVEPPPVQGGDTEVLHNARRVIWPHRWEHDKGPDELLEIATRHSEKLDLRWTILGEQFPDVPPALREFQVRFAARTDHFGFEPDRRRYWMHLGSGGWVLSTAQHEFFGLAVVEAMLAGCLPWLPPRLSYPELLPAEAQGLSPANPPRNRDRVLQAIREHLRPALAPNAVAAIDEVIAAAIAL